MQYLFFSPPGIPSTHWPKNANEHVNFGNKIRTAIKNDLGQKCMKYVLLQVWIN